MSRQPYLEVKQSVMETLDSLIGAFASVDTPSKTCLIKIQYLSFLLNRSGERKSRNKYDHRNGPLALVYSKDHHDMKHHLVSNLPGVNDRSPGSRFVSVPPVIGDSNSPSLPGTR